MVLVRKIHKDSHETYGTRRIAADLRAKGIPCGRTKARTLMVLAEVKVRRWKKFKLIILSCSELCRSIAKLPGYCFM